MLSDRCPCLTVLDLSNIKTLTGFYGSKVLTASTTKPVIFQALKTLILSNNTFLTVVDVEGSHMQNISVDGCSRLQ